MSVRPAVDAMHRCNWHNEDSEDFKESTAGFLWSVCFSCRINFSHGLT